MFDETPYEYVGSWARVGATLIDSMLALFLMAPLLTMIYGRAYWDNERRVVGRADFFISWVVPAVAVIAFWLARGATPGKMAVSAQVVHARTGAKPSVGQSIGRHAGYYVSAIRIGPGLLWVGIDPKKQGWRDKLAGTVVARCRQAAVQADSPALHVRKV